MNDFDYEWLQQKKLARNAYNHVNYRRGKMKLPHEFLTKKEREALNGEVKVYNLRSPMSRAALLGMSVDLQKEYLEWLQQTFRATDGQIAGMFGCSDATVRLDRIRLGVLSLGRGNQNRRDKGAMEAWNNWRAGAVNEEPITEEAPVKEDDCEDGVPVETNVPVLTPVTPPAVTNCAPSDVGAVESYRVSFRMVHSWDEFYELCSRFPFPEHPAQISLEVW